MAKKIGFLFNGQGTQYPGMGWDFYNHFNDAKHLYDTFLDPNIKNLCFHGPRQELNKTQHAQVAIFMTSYVIATLLKKHKVIPVMMAGLSLGELTALSFTQALSLADGIASVTKRGQIIADALHGHDSSMMAIIGLKTSTIQKICEKVATVGVCEIATFSYPGQIVISGHKNALEIAKVECLKYGAKRVIPLNVAGAFHSSLLNNAAASFEKELASITFKNSQIPIVFNTTGKVETDNLKNIVVKQLHSPIYFQQSIEFMINKGVDYFIEIGPGNILRGYVRKINPQIACYSVNTVDDLQRCVDYLR